MFTLTDVVDMKTSLELQKHRSQHEWFCALTTFTIGKFSSLIHISIKYQLNENNVPLKKKLAFWSINYFSTKNDVDVESSTFR